MRPLIVRARDDLAAHGDPIGVQGSGVVQVLCVAVSIQTAAAIVAGAYALPIGGRRTVTSTTACAEITVSRPV
jgi:hypothetical protein